MSKPPSDATTIRHLRRDLRRENDAARRHAQESNRLAHRVDVAEKEAEEWKRRFDLLLARTPEAKP